MKTRMTPRVRRDTGFIALLLLGVIVLCWRARFGFDTTYDEPFYLTISHRLLLGDALIADEWNVSQLSAVMNVPLIALYRLLTGGTDGLILFMRHAFIAVHAAVCVFFYRRTRSYGWASVLTCVIWLFFLPYRYLALSYNTWGMELLAVAGVWSATVKPGRRLPWFVMGILLALAVLCCPYLALLWPVYGIAVLLRRLLKKRMKGEPQPLLTGRAFLLVTLGCAVTAALFLLLVLSRASLSEVLAAIPCIFSDSAHSFVSPVVKISNYLRDLSLIYSYVEFGMVFVWLMLLLLCLCIGFDRERDRRRGAYLAVACVMTIVAQLIMGDWLYRHFQTVMIPLFFLGLPAFMLCREKDRRLLSGLMLPGLIYSVCQFCASNNEEYATAIGFAVANLPAALFAARVLLEMREDAGDAPDRTVLSASRLLSALVALALVLTAGLNIASTVGWTYTDVSPAGADATLTGGPFDGIRTTAANAQAYADRMADLAVVKESGAQSVLLLGREGWPYLALDPCRYATFSAWINEGEEGRLTEYFAMHPDLVPDCVLLPHDSALNTEETAAALIAAGYVRTEGAAYGIFIRE